MAVPNASLVRKALGGMLTQRAFSKELVRELLQDFHRLTRLESTLRESCLGEGRLQERHMSMLKYLHLATIIGGTRCSTRVVCIEKSAVYKVALCQYECFQIYHTHKSMHDVHRQNKYVQEEKIYLLILH